VRLDDVFIRELTADLRLAIDRDGPRLGPELARVFRRIALLNAELVEVVVGGDVLEGVRRLLETERALAYARQAPVAPINRPAPARPAAASISRRR
jgi:hypothetical protein